MRKVYYIETDDDNNVVISNPVMVSDPFAMPPICVIEDIEEVKIYFWIKTIKADEEIVRRVINGLIYGGICSGSDIRRLLQGEIRLFFNPIQHHDYDRRRAIAKIAEVLQKIDVYVEGNG